MTSSQRVACRFTPDDNADAVGNTCAAGRTTPLSDSGSGGTTSFTLVLNTERTDDTAVGELATTPSTSTVKVALAGELLSSDQLGIEVDDDENCTAGACKLLMFIAPQTYGGGLGVSGSPAAQAAGVGFMANIRAVDSNNNLVENISAAPNSPTVTFDILENPGAPSETDPTDIALGNGQGSRLFTLNFATNTTRLQVSDGDRDIVHLLHHGGAHGQHLELCPSPDAAAG